MILTKPPTGKEFENRGTFVSLRESKVNLAERAWFISPVCHVFKLEIENATESKALFAKEAIPRIRMAAMVKNIP